MYALKKITVTEDGRQVEEVHVLGNMHRLEFYPRNTHLAAQVEYCRDGNVPCISVEKRMRPTSLRWRVTRFVVSVAVTLKPGMK